SVFTRGGILEKAGNPAGDGNRAEGQPKQPSSNAMTEASTRNSHRAERLTIRSAPASGNTLWTVRVAELILIEDTVASPEEGKLLAQRKRPAKIRGTPERLFAGRFRCEIGRAHV